MADSKIHHSKINIYDFFFANKARKTYTNLGISLILIIILLIFALRPTILTIGKIRDKITQYEQVNEKVEKKIENAQNLAQQMSRTSSDYPGGLEEELTFLDKVFFNDPNIKTVYNNLHRRADDSSVVIRNFTPKYVYNNPNVNATEFDQTPASPSTKYYEMSFSVESKNLGNVEKFVETLEGFQQNPIFSRIKSISISNQIEESRVKGATSSQGSLTTPIVVCNVVMLVYLDESRMPVPTVAGQ